MDEDSENLPMPMANVNVKDMFTSLNKPSNKVGKDRLVAYGILASSLESKKDTTKIIQQYSTQLFKYLSRDVLSQESEIVAAVTKIVLFCVKDKLFLERITKDEAEGLLVAVLKAGRQKQSEDVTKQLLSILGQQRLPIETVTSQVAIILDTLEFIHTEGNGKTLYGADIIEVLVSMHTTMAQTLTSHAQRWCRMVLPCLGHPLASVRAKSFDLLKHYKPSLSGNSELGKLVLKTIDNDLGKTLLSLVAKNPQYVMDVWCFVLDIAGKAMHKGSTINVMLEIIENGFKGSQESRIFSFRAWRKLIDNFALEQDVISDAKRIRLVMMVLKTNNAKVEMVALEKVQTWWHFVRSIGIKLPSVLEQITYPLVQFCVGCINQSSQSACPSPNFALNMSSPCASKALANIQSRIGSQQLPSFPVLQKIGFEVISHLVSGLSDNSRVQGVKWTLDPLPIEVFASSANFVKHAPFLMTSLETLLKSVGSQDREALVVHIWTRLSEHLKVALEKGGKADCRDVFSAFLSHFHALVQADCLQPQILVTLFQSTSDFPNKVLSSTLYNTGIGTAVKGCPALRLCETLFLPAFLKLSNEKEVHQRLFSRLVSAGASKQQGALSFIQSVADILDSASSNLASADDLYRLWSILAHALLDFVTSTNEVNQGDALEYNFGCLYAVLLLPVQHQLASKISQVVCKVMLRTWKELYHSFARLSALVTNAEANTCLEEISAKVIGIWRPEFKDAANLEYIASICTKMLDCVDFSAVSTGRKQSSFTLSPSKWTKRRQRPLGNFHSFVHLLEKMQLESNTLLDQLEDKAFSQQKQAGFSGCFLSYTNLAVDIYCHLFTHIPSTVVSQVLTILAAPMARLFNSKAHRTGGVKIFVPSVMSKLEKLWFVICNCVTGRFSDQYDSSFLTTLSPLLEVTFPHFRRAIKSQTVTFWSTTFGKSVGLTYPGNLKPVLSAVKEKTAIVLPGWITIDDNVIAETPFTEVSQSQGESQVPAPVLPGFPSPKRYQKGSFLHKDPSPARKSPTASKVSPAKVISPKDAKNLFSGRRNISADLNMMSDKDFVVISSPTKKRRVLTEHQKEVLKEKRIIPVMYSNLDASQDTSLMAQLNAESQQESISCSDVIVIDSQASQGKEKAIGSGLQKGLPLRANSSVGFTMPKHIKPPVRRRSSRIQEMSNDDDSESMNNKGASAKKSEKPTLKESEMEKEGAHSDDKQLLSAAGNVEVQNKDLALSSLITSTEVTPETSPSLESNSSTSDKVEVPAFGMFRTKNSSSNNVQSETIDESSTSSPKPRRISLRKIKTQEGESSLDVSAVPKVGDLEVNKVKSPRRVPLQRINDLKTSSTNVATASELETQKEEAASVPQEDTSKQDSEVIVKSPKSKSSLDKWLAKSNPPKMPRRESPRKKRKFSEIEEEKSPVIPITLVEDTQSPGKVRRTHRNSECIAETPVKSDDSPSPAIRSVRKLFADDEPATLIVNGNVADTPKTHAVKVVLPTNSVGSEDEVSLATPNNDVADDDKMEILSQGFVASIEGSHALAENVPQGTHSLKDSSKEKNVGTNVHEMSQSENLFASPEDTDSMEPLMSMHMPTLASQTKDFGINSAKSESSISSRTSSSVESDPKDKIMSGTESEFDPSQATLREECSKTASVNRKKIIVRETLASTRSRRSNAQRTDSSDKKSLSKCEDSLVSMTEGNATCNEDQAEVETGDEKAVEDPLMIDATNETETGHKLRSKHDLFESKKESDQTSLDIGEVTPLIKPSNENSSSQRCSTTKKKRLIAKQLSQQRQSPDMSKVETDCDIVESGKMKRKRTRKLVSSTIRKLSPGVSPPTVRSRHVLRIRTKAVKTLCHLPPARRRRFENKDVNVDLTGNSSADDDQTLSSLVKQAKLSSSSEKEIDLTDKFEEKVADEREAAKKSSDEDSEDDQPLASLVSTNAVVERVEVKASNQICSISKEQADFSAAIVLNSSQDAMLEEDAQKCSDVNEKVVLERETGECNKERECSVEDMPSTEEEIPLGQVTPPMNIEGIDGSIGSDEVFDNVRIGSKATPIPDNDMEIEVTRDTSKDSTCEESKKEISAESTKESCEKILTAVSYVSESGMQGEGDDANLETKEDDLEQKEATEFVLSNWSPSKSPSCSILRKVTTPSSCDKGSRKVSFAEPVVSGESPVREKYHSEALPTSPLICHSYNTNFTRPGSSGIKASRGSNYRRRLETSMKKQVHSNLRQRCTGSPTSSPSSQNMYKATQESQLDSINPIFPDLVDCKTSLDCILPQLTSSLWYRGLCQLMKGRNLHTIGDLSALTEVQVNQMPIRCPKVDTVRDALTNYLSQHGGVSTPKSQSKSIFGNTTPSLEGLENGGVNQGTGTPVSNGATLSQAVTPSSIADEGIRILPSAEQDLSQLSPIKDPNTNLDPPEVASLAATVPEDSSTQSLLKPSSSVTSKMPQSIESSSSNKCTNIVDTLSSITNKDSLSELKGLSMTQLFEVHQKLNNLFGVVVEEMRERSLKS